MICSYWWVNIPLRFLWIIDVPLFPMLFAVPFELNMFALFGFELYFRWQKSSLHGTYLLWLDICLCVCPGASLKPGHGLISGRVVGRSNWTQYSAQAMSSLWMSAVTADGNNTTVTIWKTLGCHAIPIQVSSYTQTHTYKHYSLFPLEYLILIGLPQYSVKFTLIKLVFPSKQFPTLCITAWSLCSHIKK